MDEFLEYLLVMDELDEVFWGKEKENKEEENVLKRILTKDEDKQRKR